MKYIVMDHTEFDVWTKEFNDLEEAIKYANIDFDHMGEHDKKERTEYCILESVNPDEESENHYDGEVIKRYI